MPFWVLVKDDGTHSDAFGAGCIGFMNCLHGLSTWSEGLRSFKNDNIKSLMLDCHEYFDQFTDPKELAAQILDGPLFHGFNFVKSGTQWYWEAPLKGEYKDRTISSMMLLRNLSENVFVQNSFKFLRDEGLTPYQAVIAASLLHRCKRLDGTWTMCMRRYDDDMPFNTECTTVEMLIAIIKGDVSPEYWQTTWEDPGEPYGYHCDGEMSNGDLADFDDEYGNRLDLRRCMFISDMRHDGGTLLCEISHRDYIFMIVDALVKGE